MGEIRGSGHCPHCGTTVLTAEQRPTHLLHFLITILSFGAWSVVWVLLTATQYDALCTRCGTIVRHGSIAGPALLIFAVIGLFVLAVAMR